MLTFTIASPLFFSISPPKEKNSNLTDGLIFRPHPWLRKRGHAQ